MKKDRIRISLLCQPLMITGSRQCSSGTISQKRETTRYYLSSFGRRKHYSQNRFGGAGEMEVLYLHPTINLKETAREKSMLIDTSGILSAQFNHRETLQDE